MTRYFLHLRDGTEVLLDPDGSEFESEEALAAAMLRNVRDLMKGDVETGLLDLSFRLDAETADGRVARSLPFAEAIEIKYPERPARTASA